MDPLPPPPPRITTPPMMQAAYEQGEKKNGKKWFFLFAVFLIVSLGAYYLLFFRQTDVLQTVKEALPVITSPTPTPDQTLSWQAYTATDGGFSIKYPKEWVSDERKTTILIGGKSYPGVSLVAGLPYTQRQLETQSYLHTAQAPKNNEHFTLLYAVSPDFETMSLDTIAASIMDKKALATDTKKNIVVNNQFDAVEVGYGCRAACVDIIFKKNSLLIDAGTGANADASIEMLRLILSTLSFSPQ